MSETEAAERAGEGLTHREWSEALRDGELLGLRCVDCGRAVGTPKAACVGCGSRDLDVEALPDRGVVHTETTIGVPPEGVDERGYTVGVVELGDAQVMARITDDVDVGDEVRFEGASEGDRPTPVFAPAE